MSGFVAHPQASPRVLAKHTSPHTSPSLRATKPAQPTLGKKKGFTVVGGRSGDQWGQKDTQYQRALAAVDRDHLLADTHDKWTFVQLMNQLEAQHNTNKYRARAPSLRWSSVEPISTPPTTPRDADGHKVAQSLAGPGADGKRGRDWQQIDIEIPPLPGGGKHRGGSGGGGPGAGGDDGPEPLTNYADIDRCPEDMDLQHELLDKLVILKLNGGLGTSMGCLGPKSTVVVRDGLTFLDMTVRQVEFLNSKYGADVPLILMNSFNTHAETTRFIQKYDAHNLRIMCFEQSTMPRLDPESLRPLPTHAFTEATKEHWYPPGHGDVYRSMANCGLLEQLLAEGKEYMFISNVDNLGATVDLGVVYHFVNSDAEFCMEVTNKTRADIKGGTLVKYTGAKPAGGDGGGSSLGGWGGDGRGRGGSGGAGSGNCVRLLEAAQVPPKHMDEFTDMKVFNLFNTNNLWVKLRATQRLVQTGAIQSEVIEQRCTLSDGTKALQLETVAGAAIRFFEKAFGMKVPRTRFLPVKTTSDLFLIQSNLFTARHGSLTVSPRRQFPSVPIVKLGSRFKNLADYRARVYGQAHHGTGQLGFDGDTFPDLIELDHLTVSGDVTFGKNVTLKGAVIIVAEDGRRIDIAEGSVLENAVITGHLRIMDH